MSKGKFEAAKKPKTTPKNANPYAVKDKPKPDEEGGLKKYWPVLVSLIGVAVAVVGIIYYVQYQKAKKDTADSSAVTTELTGMPRAELEQRAADIDTALKTKDMILTMSQELVPGEQTEDPIVLTLKPEQSKAGLDLQRLTADLDAGKGKTGSDLYTADLAEYLTLDKEAVRSLAEKTAEEFGTEFAQTSVEEITEKVPVEPSDTETPDPDEEAEPAEETEPAEEDARFLVIHTGVTGRSITAEEITNAIFTSYDAVLAEKSTESAFSPELSYTLERPEPVDVEALYKKYCTEPKDATLDEKTFEVVADKPGYGFDKEEVLKLVEKAEEGEELKIRLQEIPAEMTAEKLRESMFQDVLAEAHTNHSPIPARTNNLILACKAIDGTVVLPGQVFSFNRTVGERTEAKGYLEAIAYVEGGASKPETGGGVCQVASSIYYAVLQADLKTVERAPHMYLVDYVPGGMDAAIYWGQLDYKFENNSPYPLKIQASVSDGQVHIVLLGTEWKDYTVEMSYEVLSTTPWEVKEEEVPNDGEHYTGEVLATPYTGYRIATYKTTYNKNGEKIETTKVEVSNYNKRDKIIAVVGPVTTEPPATEPPATEPPATEPPATEPPATEPPATEPPATEPPATEPPATEPPAPSESESDPEEGG